MAATLLLADDNVTMQRVVELTFAREGLRVVTAADGASAMARLGDDRPDIVLVDVALPGVDGYQIAERVKHSADLSAVPVLLLTGAFDPIDEARARAAGCDGVVVKPFDPQQLVDLVMRLLAGERPGPVLPEPVAEDVPAFVLDDLDEVLTRQEPVAVEPPPVPAAPATPTVPAALDAPVPSLADAFAALLAAERPPAIREELIPRAVVEDVVRRVVARMTDEVVRNLVMETAERFIREELDRLQQ